MKKNLFYLFALICSMSLFMACSDDDELTPEPTPDPTPDTPGLVIDESVFGDYKGTLTIAISDVQVGTLSQKISVTQASDSTLNLSLTDFSFLGIEVGDVELADCEVTQDGEDYDFTGTTSLSVTGLTADVEGTGTVSAAGNISLNLDIAAVLGTLEQSVTVTYEGSKLTGDEGTEALITAFTFDSDAVTEQPTINEDGTITFKVLDGADITALVPTITVSEGATVTPASGEAQDFSNPVTYTVVSEDYGTTTTYEVSVAAKQTSLLFSFDEWKEVGTGPALHKEPLPDDQLASSVQGASLLFLFGVEGFPVYEETEDVISGSAIKLVTMDTSDKASALVPALTAGSVFTGVFDMGPAMTDKMLCTQFGISYDKKPVSLRGYYKYTPGEKYIDGEGATSSADVEVIEGQVDECSIQAVLYEEELDEDNKNIPLNGHDINTSERRVAVATLSSGAAQAEWTRFELPFEMLEGKTYDSSKKYQLAIVCSSSKLGDLFKGAGGSTLLLDELEVIGE